MRTTAPKPTGNYKLLRRRPAPGGFASDAHNNGVANALIGGALRSQRIIDSLRCQIAQGGEGQELRVRQIFAPPREMFRLEHEVPAMSYQRTTLLDRDALEELLEDDTVRGLLTTTLDASEKASSA